VGANAHPEAGLLPSQQQEGQTCAETGLSGLTYADRNKKISRDKRLSRYGEVMALYREGVGQRAIAGGYESAGTPCNAMSPRLASQNEQQALDCVGKA